MMEARPNLVLANALNIDQAMKLRMAAEEALEALAHCGSSDDAMGIMADLLVVSYRESAKAFSASEKLKTQALSGASQGDAPAGQRALPQEGR